MCVYKMYMVNDFIFYILYFKIKKNTRVFYSYVYFSVKSCNFKWNFLSSPSINMMSHHLHRYHHQVTRTLFTIGYVSALYERGSSRWGDVRLPGYLGTLVTSGAHGTLGAVP